MSNPIFATAGYFVITAMFLGSALWSTSNYVRIGLLIIWSVLSLGFEMYISDRLGYPAHQSTIDENVNIVDFIPDEANHSIFIWTLPEGGIPRAVAYPYSKDLHKLLAEWKASDAGQTGMGRLVRKSGEGRTGDGKGHGLEEEDTSSWVIEYPSGRVPQKG